MSSIEDKYIVVMSHCVVTKGKTRSIVCDLQRQEYTIIPNDLAHFLENAQNRTIGELRILFGTENSEIIDEYLSFLIELDFIYFSSLENEQIRFPALNTEIVESSIISNAVVEIDINNFDIIYKLLSSLMYLGCKHIEIRFFHKFKKYNIISLLDYLDDTQIMNINLVLPYQIGVLSIDFVDYFLKNQRLKSILYYNSPFEKRDVYHSGLLSVNFTCLDNQLNLHCGISHPSYFAISVPTYIESISFNSCLNKKVAIDRHGNIKNCPSMVGSYGNIYTENIFDVISNTNFKSLWGINKSQIETCKVCEFRNICTDCRAFLEAPNDLYSKPLKCGYNPDTNIWEDWSTNPIKQKTFLVYK